MVFVDIINKKENVCERDRVYIYERVYIQSLRENNRRAS